MIVLDDNKIQFTVQRQKHIIGSKLFPVSSKSKLQVFNSEYTEELDKNDPNILRFTKLVDQCKFEMGHAYTSSDIILQIADAINLEAKFFSGWLIYPFSNTFPTHHAWTVINGSSVVDVMQFPEEIDIMMKTDMTDPDFKRKLAIKLVEGRKKNLFLNHVSSVKLIMIGFIMLGVQILLKMQKGYLEINFKIP